MGGELPALDALCSLTTLIGGQELIPFALRPYASKGSTMRMSKGALLLAALTLLVLASPASAAVSSAPDSTPQTDGIVFSVLPVGDRIYIGGDFTHVDGVPRDRLAAIDATTGKLTDWNPGANKRVAALAASSDGTRIYAGGDFTAISGVSRNRLAALQASTGAPDTNFKAEANSTVRAIAVSGDRAYLGGSFTTVNGQSRTRLARVNATTGALASTWTPTADNHVRTLALSPDGARLYAGGDFLAVSGQSRSRLAALSPTSGAVDTWRPRIATNGTVFGLAVAGSRVYTAEGGPGGAAASYDAGTGNRTWMLSGDGDGQAVTVLGTKVYIGGHFINFAGQRRPFFAAADAATGGLDSLWTPSGGGATLSTAYTTGVWSLAPDGSRGRLYAGTNFAKVNGESHAGFVQFSSL